MPTYGYACSKCEAKFDVFHSMKCTDEQYCPTCGGAGKKLISGASIIFKGSGFYSTDYRDSGYVEAQKRESTPSSSTSTPSPSPSPDTSSPSSSTSTSPSTPSTPSTPSAPSTPSSSPSSSGSTSSSGTSSGTSGTVAKAA